MLDGQDYLGRVMRTDIALNIKNLTKVYKTGLRAVDNISLDVKILISRQLKIIKNYAQRTQY
jgi:hypothetical protein